MPDYPGWQDFGVEGSNGRINVGQMAIGAANGSVVGSACTRVQGGWKMNVNLVGFQWKLPGTVSPSDFFKHLGTLGIKYVKFKGYDRLLPTEYHDGYFTGVFLTVKAQTKFTAIDLMSHAVTVEQLAQGKNLVDFNFFSVNPLTLSGIYQYYHNSPTVSTFCDFIASQYKVLRKKLVEDEGGPGTGPGGNARLSAAKKKYPDEMDTKQLNREDKLPELLNELHRIRSCDLGIAIAGASEKMFYPNLDEVNSQALRVSFSISAKQDSIRKNLLQLIARLKSGRGRIIGNDEAGNERTVFILDTPDIFGTYKYEEIVSTGFINFKNPGKSPFLGIIVKEMTALEGVFGDAPPIVPNEKGTEQ